MTLPEFRLASRASSISRSPTLAIMAKAIRLRAAGVDVVDFSAGQPDFDTPRRIREAGKRAIESGHTRYTPTAGASELRRAVVRAYRRDFDLEFDLPQVLITNGGKHALMGLLLATCEAGDEVVVPTPCWPSFPELARIVGAKPVFARGSETGGFRPDRRTIEPAITSRTRAIILNVPANPSGVTLAPADLEAVAALARDADCWLIWDDTYAHLVFEPAAQGCYRRMADILGHRLLINGSASKSFAMTGWRIGWALGPEPVIRAATAFQSQMTSNACSISQQAAAAALDTDPGEFAWMAQTFGKRMKAMRAGLLEIPGVRCAAPDGGFYLFPDFSRRMLPDEDSTALAAALLDAEQVATVPGSAFAHDRHLRFSFTTSGERIRQGLARVRRFFASR